MTSVSSENDGENAGFSSASKQNVDKEPLRGNDDAFAAQVPTVQVPVACCGFALGITGFVGLLRFATTQLLGWDWQSLPPAGVACIVAVVVVVFGILITYVSLGLKYGGLMSDLKDPTKRCLISAGAMAILNVGALICSLWSQNTILHQGGVLLFYAGAALHFVLQPLTLRELLRCPKPMEVRIVWVIPLVGIGLVAQPDCMLLATMIPAVLRMVTLTMAIVYYVPVSPLVLFSALRRYSKLRDAAAAIELPHVCVLLAPAGVSLNAWLSVAAPQLPETIALVGAVYLMANLIAGLLVVLWFAPNLARLPLTPSAAAYTFPFQIAGSASLRWLILGLDGTPRDLSPAARVCAWIIFVVASLPSSVAVVAYIQLIFQNRLLVRRPLNKGVVV